MTLLMYKFRIFIIFSLLSLSANAIAGPRIYIIRHAEVDIESPGWGSSKEAFNFKEQYNKAPIRNFAPEPTLKKINNSENIDTIFCSPQMRAVQTAHILFGNKVILNINENLMELQYPVIKCRVIRMPVRVWLTASMIFWMAGTNNDSLPSYRQRKHGLEKYSEEIIKYSERHDEIVIVAHGVVNKELIRILKKKGWKSDQKDGFGNLSVNCLMK